MFKLLISFTRNVKVNKKVKTKNLGRGFLLISSVLLVGTILLSGCTNNKEENKGNVLPDYIKRAIDKKSIGMPIPGLYGKELSNLSLGDVSPDFQFTDIYGKDYSLSDFKGKSIILDFTATWCGMVFEERDAFKILKQEHKDNLAIISINTYELDSNEDYADYVARYGGDWIHFVDKGMNVTKMYGVRQTVTTFIVNKEGIIVYKDNWITSLSTLKSELEKII